MQLDQGSEFSAVAGKDYEHIKGTAVFNAGEAEYTIKVKKPKGNAMDVGKVDEDEDMICRECDCEIDFF